MWEEQKANEQVVQAFNKLNINNGVLFVIKRQLSIDFK